MVVLRSPPRCRKPSQISATRPEMAGIWTPWIPIRRRPCRGGLGGFTRLVSRASSCLRRQPIPRSLIRGVALCYYNRSWRNDRRMVTVTNPVYSCISVGSAYTTCTRTAWTFIHSIVEIFLSVTGRDNYIFIDTSPQPTSSSRALIS